MLIPFQFNDLQNVPVHRAPQDPEEDFKALPLIKPRATEGWRSLSFRSLGEDGPALASDEELDGISAEERAEPAPEEDFEVQSPAPLINRERLKALEDEARERGYQDGLQAGRAAGLAAAEAEIEARMEAELTQIQALKDQLIGAEAHLFDAIKGDLIRLLQLVPRRIIREELRLKPQAVVSMAEELLGAFAAQRRLTLRAHPEDARLLQAELKGSGPDEDGRLTILPDPTLGRADLRLITESGEIDATIETQLGRYYKQVEGWIRGSHGDEPGHKEGGL